MLKRLMMAAVTLLILCFWTQGAAADPKPSYAESTSTASGSLWTWPMEVVNFGTRMLVGGFDEGRRWLLGDRSPNATPSPTGETPDGAAADGRENEPSDEPAPGEAAIFPQIDPGG